MVGYESYGGYSDVEEVRGEERVEKPSWTDLEPVDVGELMFGKSLDRFFLDVSSPKLIIAAKPHNPSYGYVQFLAKVLRDVYRVFHGSIPLARYVQALNDVQTRLPWLPVQGSITVIDLGWGLTKAARIEVLSRIEERLREFVSQGPGFLVLYVDRGAVYDVEKLVEKVFNDVACPDVLEVAVDESRPLEEYLKVVAFYTGFASFEEFESVGSVDSLTMYLDAVARRVLAEVAVSEPRVSQRLSVCAEGEEIHRFWLRALVLKNLVLEGVRDESTYVCYRFARGLDVDVYVRDRDEAYVVETLTNARLVEARIRYVVSSLLGGFSRINLVIPNNVALLFPRRILSTLREVCRWGGYVELFTVDVVRQRLIPLKEFFEKLKMCRVENAEALRG